MPSVDKMVQHDVVDRVLQAICTGANTLELIQQRCSIEKGAARRSADKLVKDAFVVKDGDRMDMTLKPTEKGRKASGWIRGGGTRRGPKLR